jgi:hypothetical protein
VQRQLRQPTVLFSKDDFLLQKKLENATEGMRKGWLLRVAAELKEMDKLLIADFINDLQNTENIRFGIRRLYITNLFYLAKPAFYISTWQQ